MLPESGQAAAAAPAAASVWPGLICRVNPYNTRELDSALALPVDTIAFNCTPRELWDAAARRWKSEPVPGLLDKIASAGKRALPIVIPCAYPRAGTANPVNGLPDDWEMTPGAWLQTDTVRLPRWNDPKWTELMRGFAAGQGALWQADARVVCVRVAACSVNTNEPSGYGNEATAVVAGQMQQAAAVPAGTPAIPAFRFTDKGDPVYDGHPDDGLTIPSLLIYAEWARAFQLSPKCAMTIKFPDGSSESGYRQALLAATQRNGSLALNTGANDAQHPDALAYAAGWPFGWGGMTLQDPGKATGKTGAALRDYVADVCVPPGGPPVHCWQAEVNFFQTYPATASTIRGRLK